MRGPDCATALPLASPVRLLLIIHWAAAAPPSSGVHCSGHGTLSVWHNLFGCQCDAGWQGSDCSVPVCSPVCENGGTCKAPDLCECPAGFVGAACAERTCPTGCSGHGTCINGTCACGLLWSGPSCAEPACPNDCSGHGTCEHNVCKCNDGWLSLDCSVASCPRDCSAHGDCLPDGHCKCWAGWMGEACDGLACAVECGPHGTCAGGVCVCAHAWAGERCDQHAPLCVDTACGWPRGFCAANGTCACASGWKGARCDERDCPAGCEHGVCTPSGTCFCTGGWSGDRCDLPACPGSPPCSQRGHCLPPGPINNYTPTCKCYAGYGGAACEVREGCAGGCGAHGTCVDGACRCAAGWTGANCAERGCGVEGCGGHGRCVRGTCRCFGGWAGAACETAQCPAGCSSHGRCVHGLCECAGGWRGDNCSEPVGCPDECWASLGRGMCVGGAGAGATPAVCACAKGFVGENCGLATPALADVSEAAAAPAPSLCIASRCGVHGACDPFGGAGCVCEKGWHGDACDLIACAPAAPGQPSACGPHGICVEGLCRCDLGYSSELTRGRACERECTSDCSPPFGACAGGTCLCVAGRGGTDCAEVLCPNGCSKRGVCAALGRCECHAGFGGADCSIRLCETNCSGHGVCELPEAARGWRMDWRSPAYDAAAAVAASRTPIVVTAFPARCRCDRGWTGEQCELPTCPRACSQHGVCMPDGACECWPGWTGVDCADRQCPRDPLSPEPEATCRGSAHGTCDRATGRCRCLPGWRGLACERPACLGTPSACSGRGACLVDVGNRLARCACDPPYAGPACEAAACAHNCSGHGDCVQPPDRRAGLCICQAGWRGADCAQRACEHDCHGRGDCTAAGECVCNPGWDGPSCATPACPGDRTARLQLTMLNHSSSLALAPLLTTTAMRVGGGPLQGCHAERAQCDVERRVCVCAAGWTGPGCADKACPSNCNGHGTCVHGSCQCDPYFEGDACERAVRCASGCSNHGSCDALTGACVCAPGRSGAACEHPTCAPIEASAPPCSARGRCLGGTCECDDVISRPQIADDTAASSAMATDASMDASASAAGAAAGLVPASSARRITSVGSRCRAELRCMHGCNGRGACDASRGMCVCEAGWYGEWCQHRECAASGCGTHGWCEHGGCRCDAGWTGIDCSMLKCVGGCMHGSCEQPARALGEAIEEGEEAGFAQCRCHRGWAGADCSVPDPYQRAELYVPNGPPPPVAPSNQHPRARPSAESHR